MAAIAQEKLAAPSAKLKSGKLSFLGHSTVGDFVGSTQTVAGEVAGAFPNLRGWVDAPVATLVTANKRRDRDLRASMEADRYPMMRLDVSGTTPASSLETRGDTLAVLLHGHLEIHGVTRSVELPVVVSRTADTIQVMGAFLLDLAYYRIRGLTRMFGLLRMEREIEVWVDLRFVSVEDVP